MKKHLLNLSGLHARADSPAATRGFSRRGFLSAFGLTALATAPAVSALADIVQTGVRFDHDGNVLRVWLGNEVRWLIDPARFAGAARLVFEQTADTVRIALTGARYPGTAVPADLTCDLRRELGGWSARLRLACGNFDARVPFARWLSGQATARAMVNFSGAWLDAINQAHVTAPHTGEAVFTPDWKLAVMGEGRFSGLGSDFALASLAVALPTTGATSRLFEPGAVRSTLTLGRGLQFWALQPTLQGSHGRRFNTAENAFGQLVIESEENTDGSGRRVIEAIARDGALGFEPGTGAEENRFTLPLNQARYAVAFEGDVRQTAVVGRFAPAWMPAGACSLYLGDAATAPAFEASGTDDELDDVVCTPAVLGVAASSDDFLAHSPSTCEAPALLAFTTESDKPRQIAQVTTARKITVPAGAVTAPEDNKTVQAANAPSTTTATTARKINVPATPVTVIQANKPAPTVPIPAATNTTVAAKPPLVAEMPKDITSKTALGELLVKDGGILKYALPLTATIDVLRRDDFLNLSFDFENFSIEGNGNNAKLIRSNAKNPSRVRVTFPPQSIVEEAILDETSEVTRQLSARMAQSSILVFQMPSGQQDVPFDLEELLKALTDWPLVVGGSAAAPKLPAIVAYNGAQTSGSFIASGAALSSQNNAGFGYTPKPAGAGLNKISEVLPEAPLAGPSEPSVGPGSVTQIEFPYRLILSPNRYARWNHRSEPLKNAGRTELWHTIMGLVPGADPRLLRLRAIWSPDYATTGNPDQGPAHSKAPKTGNALQPIHRRDLVKLTASASPASLDPILTIDSRLFILSSLGAWADLNYSNYSAPTGVGLIGWQHRSTMGRDHYVKVDVLGYLFPFGHEAVLTTISERKIVEGVAALRQHSFITVREPLKLYPADTSAGSVELLFPFRSVRINNPRTPNLSSDREPIFPGKKPSPKEEIFYISTLAGDLPFSMTATDWAGGTSHFSMPLAFFSKTAVEAPNNAGLVITVNNAAFYAGSGQKINLMPDNIKSDHDNRRTAEFNGQAVALAPSLKPGDSTYSVDTLRFVGLPGFANGKAPFHPAVERIEAAVPAIQHLLGTTTPLTFAYANIYRTKGFGGGNAGEIVLQLAQGAVYGMTSNATNLTWDVTALPPIAMPFSAERAGGVASPNFSIGGLSRKQGPIGVAAGNAAKVAASLEKFAGNNFDPKEFFSGAKLFGTLDLADLIKQAGVAENAPKLVHIPKVDGSVEINYDFTSPLREFSMPFVDFKTTGGQLTLHNSIKSGTLQNPASTYSQGRLTNFSLTLASAITVAFKELSFTSANGKKPDFSVVLAPGTPTFQGPLALLNSVMSLLDSTGLSDPPFVNVDASGATVGYTLALPDIALGAWALSNLKISSALTLPFTGDPVRMRFAFCERNDPLGVTVSILSGGGFFAMTVSVKGLEEIEASFELGGRLQISLGVASGVIYAMAGIYFSLDKSSGTSVVTFSAYLRVGGAVQVLHLITVSIELNLSLSYSPSTHMLSGEASVSVCVHIAFFSKKVSFKVHKDIAGPGSGSQASLDAPAVDHAFAHHESSRWATYSNAFA